MSLLLDALKKASLDKQKSAEAASASATTVLSVVADDDVNSNANTDELTLDLEPMQNSAANENEKLAEQPATELLELATDITPLRSEIRHETGQYERKSATPAKVISPPPAIITEPPAPTAPPPETSKPAADKLASAALVARQASAKQRDALDLLINKSRQSGEQKRTLQTYGLVAFSVLLLLLGGIYFYLSNEPTPLVADIDTVEEEAVVEEAPVIKEAMATKPTSTSTSTSTSAAPVVRAQTASSSIPAPRRTVNTAPPIPKSAPEPLQFTRTVRVDPIASLLDQAYTKFQAGDYDGANQLYTQVLQREPDNRDGLLGAAAVAMKQQRLEHAHLQYQKLLRLDPKDTLARAGISFIDMNVRDESQLKFILREQPDAAHLHFALGALHSSQNRWAEAQQSYFNAVTHDSQNADYAYNLAVSLDQLGQYKAARGFYQKALQLALGQRASFVVAETQTRIDQLSNLPDNSK